MQTDWSFLEPWNIFISLQQLINWDVKSVWQWLYSQCEWHSFSVTFFGIYNVINVIVKSQYNLWSDVMMSPPSPCRQPRCCLCRRRGWVDLMGNTWSWAWLLKRWAYPKINTTYTTLTWQVTSRGLNELHTHTHAHTYTLKQTHTHTLKKTICTYSKPICTYTHKTNMHIHKHTRKKKMHTTYKWHTKGQTHTRTHHCIFRGTSLSFSWSCNSRIKTILRVLLCILNDGDGVACIPGILSKSSALNRTSQILPVPQTSGKMTSSIGIPTPVLQLNRFNWTGLNTFRTTVNCHTKGIGIVYSCRIK